MRTPKVFVSLDTLKRLEWKEDYVDGPCVICCRHRWKRCGRRLRLGRGKWGVEIPITGAIYFEVEAKNKKDALEKGFV